MRYILAACLLIVSAVPASSRCFAADDQGGKPVRLAWFPRFSPDGAWLITAHGGWDADEPGEARVWDAETGEPRFVIGSERGVRTVGWSPKGRFFAAGNYGNVVRLYDSQTGKQKSEITYGGTVEVLQITPDEKRLITVHGGGSVRIKELASKKRVHSWEQIHQGGIWGACLSPDGELLATAGRDGIVRIFDLETFQVLHELAHPGDTNGVAFTKDGKALLTGCGDAKIRVFDVETGAELRKLEGHEGGSVTDMQFSKYGKLLATCGMDGTVRLWDMTDFERPALSKTWKAHDGFAFGVAISPTGESVASAGWDNRVKLWKVATGEEIWSSPPPSADR
jgi:WD40 repeat protein